MTRASGGSGAASLITLLSPPPGLSLGGGAGSRAAAYVLRRRGERSVMAGEDCSRVAGGSPSPCLCVDRRTPQRSRTSQTHDAIFKTRETTPQTSNCGVSFCFRRSPAGLSQPQAPRARAARESRLVRLQTETTLLFNTNRRKTPSVAPPIRRHGTRLFLFSLPAVEPPDSSLPAVQSIEPSAQHLYREKGGTPNQDRRPASACGRAGHRLQPALQRVPHLAEGRLALERVRDKLVRASGDPARRHGSCQLQGPTTRRARGERLFASALHPTPPGKKTGEAQSVASQRDW
mmetsp:Transcript_36421/g.120018  ORF Transcript_36421/g.120018 Transcript_36421/m.120018 type:complete len:290 (-) Transcript_36421:546-1415(-)